MYDKSKLESRKKLNLPDLLVGEGQRGLVPKLNKIFHQAVDSVQAWHTNVIHSLKKKYRSKQQYEDHEVGQNTDTHWPI